MNDLYRLDYDAYEDNNSTYIFEMPENSSEEDVKKYLKEEHGVEDDDDEYSWYIIGKGNLIRD
jgi:hypothetical protein